MAEFTVQQTRNTAANWTSNNQILAAGEFGLETDTNRMKFGDGSTVWNSLPYAGTGANTSFKYGLYTLSVNQTSNLSVNNHIEFDETQGSLGGLSTGTGQENGIITLTGGKTYKITGALGVDYSSIGALKTRLYDRTNSITLGRDTLYHSPSYNGNYLRPDETLAIIAPVSNIDIELRVTQVNDVSSVAHVYSWFLIEEYGGY